MPAQLIEDKRLFDPLEFQFNCNHSNDISLVENARFIFGTVLRVPPFRWQIVELTSIHHVYDKSIQNILSSLYILKYTYDRKVNNPSYGVFGEEIHHV